MCQPLLTHPSQHPSELGLGAVLAAARQRLLASGSRAVLYLAGNAADNPVPALVPPPSVVPLPSTLQTHSILRNTRCKIYLNSQSKWL